MKYNLECAGADDSRIDFCITGNEALTLVKESYITGITYSFIMTKFRNLKLKIDFSMPIMNGVKSTRQMRSFLYNLSFMKKKKPFIIGVTGHV